MGVVYRARQKSLDREVALKILAPERESDDRFRARFAREARTLARLNHPGVVAVYDFGEASGIFYLVMEFVEGPNVRHLIREGALPVDEAIPLVLSVCEALDYAHDKGVVHRDIKPENLLLTRNGAVKVADFGIAEMMRGDTADAGAELGSVRLAGTPGYLAPELASAPDTVDHRADLYSLAVVLHELLTGKVAVPPPGRSSDPVLDPGVDSRLAPVLGRALETHPANRYSTAGEMADALRGAVAPVAAPPAATAKTSGRRTAVALLVGLIVVLPLLAILSERLTVWPRDDSLPIAAPVRMESPPRLDRTAAFSLSPLPGESAAFVHLEIQGRLDGEAWVADHRLEGEIDLQVSRPLPPEAVYSFEYIPITATDGELSITYWFSD